MGIHPCLLVIMCLLSIRGSCPLSTSASTGTPPRDPDYPTEDYDNLEDTTTSVVLIKRTTDVGTHKRCDYNPCHENQTPCEVLIKMFGCRCPGLDDQLPGHPLLRSVSWNGSAVVVRWCAPNSHVKAYVVTIGGVEEQTLRDDHRSAALDPINHKTEVCVFAVNDAGAGERSCMEYQPANNSLPLTAGLIGGALGLLLFALLVVLLCRRRRQKKHEARHV